MTDPMNDPTLLKLIELERRHEVLVAQIIELENLLKRHFEALENLLKRHFEATRVLVTGVPPPPPPPVN
jgi:hypothetical protein